MGTDTDRFAADYPLQCGSGDDCHHGDGRLLYILDLQLLPGYGSGMASAGILSLPNDNLRWFLQGSIYLYHSNRFRRILPLSNFLTARKYLPGGLFFTLSRHWDLCFSLLGMDERS